MLNRNFVSTFIHVPFKQVVWKTLKQRDRTMCQLWTIVSMWTMCHFLFTFLKIINYNTSYRGQLDKLFSFIYDPQEFVGIIYKPVWRHVLFEDNVKPWSNGNTSQRKAVNNNLRWLALGHETESQVDSQVHVSLLDQVQRGHTCNCVTVGQTWPNGAQVTCVRIYQGLT